MDPNCLFCKIVAGEIPAYQVYEDNDFLAFLDLNPINLGHTLLIPKVHALNLFDLPADILAKLGPVLQKVGQAVKAGTQANGLNIVMNNGLEAGQLIFHAHFHLIPRFKGDGFKHWHGQGGETKTDFEQAQLAVKKELASWQFSKINKKGHRDVSGFFVRWPFLIISIKFLNENCWGF